MVSYSQSVSFACMNLTEGEIYHVFNRGNNRCVIFPRRQNFAYFIDGLRKYVVPYCDLLAWCLMPNHFHFLIHANTSSTPMIKDGGIDRQRFSQGIKQLLSSYAKGINKQEGRTGSLFQQKTKGIQVSGVDPHYPLTAFHYIHQNPLRAGLVDRLEEWEYSSLREYIGTSDVKLCNQELAISLLDLKPGRFLEDACLAAEVSYTSEV
jgi:REP element-mobilizing transposase RayT